MHFINPMCGSGTLAIEAALIGLNRPANALRPNFGIKHIKGFDQEKWDQLRSELKQSSEKKLEKQIIATDHDPAAIKAAQKNAQTAGVDHLIHFEVCDFRKTPLPAGNGVVIMNPPYGERLGKASDLKTLYSQIGDFFKQQCTNYTGYVFTGNLELARNIGLRTNSRTELYNSTIDCRLLEYELFDGSKY
jgi:putative N6-adenine-specific DNA methylase